VQARWLSDTRNRQRHNPVQAHMSIGNMKNHETNTTPFSGACNCHIRIYTDSADLFQDQLDGNLHQKWPCSAQYYHRRAGKRKEKKQPCKTQQTACGKHKTRGPFMRTYYRNVTSEESDMPLDRKILIPSFRDQTQCFHIMAENQSSVHIVGLLHNLYYFLDKLGPVP